MLGSKNLCRIVYDLQISKNEKHFQNRNNLDL
jgi:hypothetical protein